MPHFSLQIHPSGPLLDVLVGVSEARAKALTAAGQQVPKVIPVKALLDTGASCTCIDPTVLNALGLTPTGSVAVNTPSTGAMPHNADQYDIGLLIPSPNGGPLVLRTIPVVAADFSAQGIHALIGRDILARCVMIYNGEAGFFTLAY